VLAAFFFSSGPAARSACCNRHSAKTVASNDLFGDLLVHNIGRGLADGVSQGSANGRQLRTASLWGLGQRVFFLRDGRTSDLMDAIQAHGSSGSEANGVTSNSNALIVVQQI
jgi:CxxC motif-containing protein (DUF1111 family)